MFREIVGAAGIARVNNRHARRDGNGIRWYSDKELCKLRARKVNEVCAPVT